jgi:hypothetical protein
MTTQRVSTVKAEILIRTTPKPRISTVKAEILVSNTAIIPPTASKRRQVIVVSS